MQSANTKQELPDICICISKHVLSNKGNTNSNNSSCPLHAKRDDNFSENTIRSLSLKSATSSVRANAVISTATTTQPPVFLVSDKVFITDRKLYGVIVSDATYYKTQSYKVSIDNNNNTTTPNTNIEEEVHASKLISAATSTYASPRYMPSLITHMVEKQIVPTPPIDDLFLNGIDGMTEIPKEKVESMIEAYSKLIRLAYESEENMTTFHIRRSTLYVALSEYKEALEDANSAITLMEKLGGGGALSIAYFRKGVAYFGLRRFEESLEAFKEAYAKDPSSQPVRHAFFHALSAVTSTCGQHETVERIS